MARSYFPGRYAHPRTFTIRVRCYDWRGRVYFDGFERTLIDAQDRAERLQKAFPKATVTIGEQTA